MHASAAVVRGHAVLSLDGKGAALLAGRRTPLREPGGRERKAQFWPDQLADWLGLPLARQAEAGLLLYPRITAGATPGPRPNDHTVGEADWMDGPSEDRYPDFLGLHAATAAARRQSRAAAVDVLTGLPAAANALGHDSAANADALAKATAWSSRPVLTD